MIFEAFEIQLLNPNDGNLEYTLKELKSIFVWLAIFVLIIVMWAQLAGIQDPEEIPFTTLRDYIKAEQIEKVEIHTDHIIATDIEGQEYRSNINPFAYNEENQRLFDEYGVEYEYVPEQQFWSNLLFSMGPILLLVVLYFLIVRQFQGGSNRAMQFGKSKAVLAPEDSKNVSFDDVAGCDEAKEELHEVVDFLRNHKKYTQLGARIPRGILLAGAPGTGKTLLAKAVAGEAKVPFFSISGSDFVEMFVGVGASRVRDLFSNAKKHSPCVVFVDEIDAVGRQRFAGVGGGHDEREQTLNQLLSEMDGFSPNEGVIVLAATNRPDVLDPALLRPGRFDRQVVVDYPDIKGREAIFKVHIKKVRYDEKNMDFTVLARGTPGFTGADIANTINEAALIAARKGKKLVNIEDLEEAKDKIMMGPERRSMVLTEDDKRNIAYHEAGHALCALFLPKTDPVHKVSIVPRGRALGITAYLPLEEKKNYTKTYLLNTIKILLGGRASEEMVFSEISTGASNDLQRATEIAHRMVCNWGMNKRVGLRTFGQEGEVFLGRDIVKEKDFSEETSSLIDQEIKDILDSSYSEIVKLMKDKREVLDKIAQSLMERETLTGEELEKLKRGEELPPLTVSKKETREEEPQKEEKHEDQKESDSSETQETASAAHSRNGQQQKTSSSAHKKSGSKRERNPDVDSTENKSAEQQDSSPKD